jgi:hypothetical protein
MAVPDVATVEQKGPETLGYTTGYTVARRCRWTLGNGHGKEYAHLQGRFALTDNTAPPSVDG